MAEKSKKTILIEAQDEQNHLIADARLVLVDLLGEMDEIGGEEDCKFTIRKALTKFGGEVPLTVLSRAFSDGSKLSDARKEMRDGKPADVAKKVAKVEPEIVEPKDPLDKTKTIIKRIDVPAPAATQPADGKIVDVTAEMVA